jgi:hypothetical protein
VMMARLETRTVKMPTSAEDLRTGVAAAMVMVVRLRRWVMWLWVRVRGRVDEVSIGEFPLRFKTPDKLHK